MVAPLDLSEPFVLFDDARAAGPAPIRIYRDPTDILVSSNPKQIPNLIDSLCDGNWAGFLAYEAGYALERKLVSQVEDSDCPFFWFAKFQTVETLSQSDLESLLPPSEGGWIGKPKPIAPYGHYASGFAKVQEYIKSGDIYQANLTFNCTVSTAGHPLAIYAGLRARAKAGYGAIVSTGEQTILSLSPELFFAAKDAKVTTKPMKGTATRKANAVADQDAITDLQSDPKQRAENLMIVDLLRNDLTKIAAEGSVTVPELFKVESYPTVHQMISTVTAKLRQGLSAKDIIKAIYPCGSITGAPKIRAMEVIQEVEHQPRGVYTGSIGRIDANGDAAFNVAIRTLYLPNGKNIAKLGLGSGVVADSKMEEEWRECLAKGRFVADNRKFDLIETMRFDPETGIAYLERHLNRLKASAARFNFEFDRHFARNELQSATILQTEPSRVRLLLSRTGQIAIQISPLPDLSEEIVEVRAVSLPVHNGDFRLRHKTSDRSFYDEARSGSKCFEVVFVDADGFLTEGSFTNIFVEDSGILKTPPMARGLLPGILREELIATGKAIESDLALSDLQAGFWLGNSTRGLVRARLI